MNIIYDTEKMRNYINAYSLPDITNREFKKWIMYLNEYSDFLLGNNKINDVSKNVLSMAVGNNDYDVEVVFKREDNNIFIDLDYTKDIEIDYLRHRFK